MKKSLCIVIAFVVMLTLFACKRKEKVSVEAPVSVSENSEAKTTENTATEPTITYADYFQEKVCKIKEINGTILSLVEYDIENRTETKNFLSADCSENENIIPKAFQKEDIVLVRYRVVENTYSTNIKLESIQSVE